MRSVTQMRFREMSPGKRNSVHKPREVKFLELGEFELVHYSKVVVKAAFMDDPETWHIMNGVLLQNPVTKRWVINAIDTNYNQVVIEDVITKD